MINALSIEAGAASPFVPASHSFGIDTAPDAGVAALLFPEPGQAASPSSRTAVHDVVAAIPVEETILPDGQAQEELFSPAGVQHPLRGAAAALGDLLFWELVGSNDGRFGLI